MTLIAQIRYRNMDKGCEKIFRQGKDLQNFRPVVKIGPTPGKTLVLTSHFRGCLLSFSREYIATMNSNSSMIGF